MVRRSLVFAALLALPAHALLAGTTDLRFDAVLGGVGVPGGIANVDVQFVNYGPEPAADLKITIAIPDGATYAGPYGVPSGMQCTAPPAGSTGTVTCTSASFAVSQSSGDHYFSSNVHLPVRIDSATPPGAALSFPVTMSSSNALQASQSGTALVKVATPAHLSLSVNAPSVVTAGNLLVSTVTLTNHGPGDGMSVQVYLPTPPANQQHAIPQQMSGPGWSCWASGCFNNTFPPGTATFVLTSLVPGTLTAPAVTQKFEAASENEPDYSDDTVVLTTAVDPAPQTTLTVVLTPAPQHFYAGDLVTFTATATNTGQSTAYDVDLGMSFRGTVAATTCGDPDGSDVSCTFPSLAAGATQTITSTVRIFGSPGTQVVNTAFAAAFNAALRVTPVATTLNPAPPPNRRRAAHH